MDNQQPSTSRGYNADQLVEHFHRENEIEVRCFRPVEGGQAVEYYRFEPPAIPILDKVQILKPIQPVIGLEGTEALFSFETNILYEMRNFFVIEWFVGRSAFRANRQDERTHRGTRHSMCALLDESMDGPILAMLYTATFNNGLIFEIKTFSQCCVIPLQRYAAIRRDHKRLSSRLRSISTLTRKSQSKRPPRSKSACKRTPSPEGKKGNGKKCTPQEYAIAHIMPHGSFGLYDDCPKALKRNTIICCHDKSTIFKKCSPRKLERSEPSTSGLGKKQPNPTIKDDDHKNSPRRLLPTIKWRHKVLRAPPHEPLHLNEIPERQQSQQSAPERKSRPRQREEYPPKPHSASPFRGPIMYNEAEVQRRYSSLSPPRLPTDGKDRKQQGRRFCDCWKRAQCTRCAETDDTINELLRTTNLWYCSCLRAWYRIAHEYHRVSQGIQKMNRENR